MSVLLEKLEGGEIIYLLRNLANTSRISREGKLAISFVIGSRKLSRTIWLGKRKEVKGREKATVLNILKTRFLRFWKN